jgi:hypothetical protein
VRARSQEINIFNMSLLDVLCGALGAFCFMLLTLFPYYSKAHMNEPAQTADSAALKAEYDRALRELQEAQQRIRQLEEESAKAGNAAAIQQELDQARQKLQGAQKQLEQASKSIEKLDQRFPVAVNIMWLTRDDFDIYLWRPASKPQPMPVLEHKNNAWIRGDVRTDWISGPGFEAWQMRDLIRNQPAKLYFVLFSVNKNKEPSYVTGNVLSPDGALSIPPIQMDQQTRILYVADVVRSDDDKLSLNFTPEFQKHRVGSKQ